MLALIVLIGFILGRTVKGEETGFVLEMVPLRVPGLRDVIDKTWMQMKEFIEVAFPLLIVGSAVLGVLQFIGFLSLMNVVLAPVIQGWLGLPDFTATALIFGILRKEMALETLAVMAGTWQFNVVMTPLQMYVFAVFTTIYMPCLASITMLKRVLGLEDTIEDHGAHSPARAGRQRADRSPGACLSRRWYRPYGMGLFHFLYKFLII